MARARRRPFDPFKLTWILTERCSLRCRTCRLWADDPADGPALATIRQVLQANAHLTWLNLSGDDFVDRPDAPEILDEVARRLPQLALLDFPTAGQDGDATLAALEPVLDSPIPRIYVTVSLDGPDGVHDRIRGRPGAAAAARATLRRLLSIRRPGFTAVAGMTLSRHNLPERPPPDWNTLFPADVAPRELHLNLAHHSAHYYRNGTDLAPPPAVALGLVEHLRSRRAPRLSPLELVERRYWQLARRFLRDGDAGQDCSALAASVFLAADLTVYPCSIFDRPLGRLDQVGYSLRRLPELQASHAALDEVRNRQCPRCWTPCEAFPNLLLRLGRP